MRTSDGQEIDLVLDFDRTTWALEIKLTTSPSPNDLERLNKTAGLIDASHRILVIQTPQSHRRDQQISCSLPWLIDHLEPLVER